jgi:alpha-beta hydrolase superfamily lysophospholipase
MKVTQRIVLAFYRIKLKAIELVSSDKAAAAAFQLFCTPYTRQRANEVPEVFEQAEKLSFVFPDYKIHGFRWKPEVSNGLKILICHGFDSSSYKFKRYITPLLNEGFEVFAFDAPAHGLSSGKTITAVVYRDMILSANAAYGPFHGIIAHSFGGIGVALAIEKLDKHSIKRLVLIAPATETIRSLNDFCRYLHVSDKVKEGMEKLIVQVGGQPSAWYSVARIIQSVTIPTLWIHDKSDKVTPFEDMESLTQLDLPFVQFKITEGLGHSLYREDDIAENILAFISQLKD